MDFLDPASCYRAFQTRDRRFDGRVFCGVTSTGIFCRPICPARTPKFENCRYFASAAAAQQNGFRPCLRCRPEVAPELAAWRGTFNTVSRALALITEGGLDDSDASLDALAERVGECATLAAFVSGAYRCITHCGGANATVMLAKQLIHETEMSMTEIAQAAGFGSVRRFNETFQTLFKRPPSALRHRAVLTTHDQMAETGVTLRVPYQPPYDWSAMLGYLAARAIDGVERVCDDLYFRSVTHAGHVGMVTVANQAAQNYLAVTVHFPRVEALPSILARVKRVFDVSADIQTINQHLAKSPALAALVALRPGLRAPGGWDGFELAIRAILGQQITVEAARRLLSQLVSLCGEPLANFAGGRIALTHAFPTPQQVAKANLDQLRLPSARRETLRALANAALEDAQLFYPQANIELAVERLKNIRGIGEWTAQYIALRALRETDAFPASDVALLRSATNGYDKRLTPNQLIEQSQPWRPWRAYAAQHLWAADAAATIHG